MQYIGKVRHKQSKIKVKTKSHMIEKMLELIADGIGGVLFTYEDGFVIELQNPTHDISYIRFNYTTEGELESTTITGRSNAA